MTLLWKSFHLLLAVLIAVPLGPGGICCCLLTGSGEKGLEAIAVEATGDSCCGREAPEVPTSPACPTEDGRDDCDCRAHNAEEVTGVLASGPSLVLAWALDALAPVQKGVSWAAPGAADVSESFHPPPTIPIYRALSVLLC